MLLITASVKVDRKKKRDMNIKSKRIQAIAIAAIVSLPILSVLYMQRYERLRIRHIVSEAKAHLLAGEPVEATVRAIVAADLSQSSFVQSLKPSSSYGWWPLGHIETTHATFDLDIEKTLFEATNANAERNRLRPIQSGYYADNIMTSVAFSPDGKMVVGTQLYEPPLIWDATTGETIQEWSVSRSISGSNSVAISPDGKVMVDGGYTGFAVSYERNEFNQRGFNHGGAISYGGAWHRRIKSIAFSPDGRTVAISGSEGVALRNMEVSYVTDELLIDSGVASNSVAFSPDGKILASADMLAGIVRMWDIATYQPASEPLSGYSYSIAFSPDGKTLAGAGDDGTIRRWNMATGQPIDKPMKGHSGIVWSVAFSPDGKMLASGGEDGTIRLRDASTGEAIGEPLRGHQKGYSGVRSVAFSPDGKTLASAGSDMTVRLWDVDYAIEMAEIEDLSPNERLQMRFELSVEELLQKACGQLRHHSALKWADSDNDSATTDQVLGKKATLICERYNKSKNE